MKTLAPLLLTCLFVLPATAKYSGGTGEPNGPYQIATAADLIALGETPEDYDKHFILTADIDLDPNLPGGKVFDRAVIAPDRDLLKWGFQGTSFTGVLDGDGHTISHLTITGNDYLGLLGVLGSTARVSNLGLQAVEVIGRGDYVRYVGGLAGSQSGDISSCYSTGLVSSSGSSDETVGGLVGFNRGSIATSYSTASVSVYSSYYYEDESGEGSEYGECYVGGLVGVNSGRIASSHSSGLVKGTGDYVYGYVGGLVGSNWPEGIIVQCYSTAPVSGSWSAGGLVGYNCFGRIGSISGRINNCYSTGPVSGIYQVGGLVGDNSGHIATSYSTGSVSGKDFIGGLVGRGNNITNSYSTGSVTGTGRSVGGLVGYGGPGGVSACVWDTETSGHSGSVGAVGLTTSEMMDPEMLGFNGFANDPNWKLDAGRDYPRLAWQGTPGSMIPEPEIDWLDGEGTPDSPYQIDTADQLILLGKAGILWNRHFVLGADIDLDPALPGRSVFGQALIPVFSGVFDGRGHIISNLTIEGGSYLGLFGYLWPPAQVANVGVIDVNIIGSGDFCAGLVGYNRGSITMSYSIGLVSGIERVGGLVGQNCSDSNINNCYSSGSVAGSGFCVGGLVGSNYFGSIATSYSTGSVTGNNSVGGLVGDNVGSITAGYSNASVTGTYTVGGLVGTNGGNIAASFSSGSVLGHGRPHLGSHAGGLVGINSGSITASYSTGPVSGTQMAGGLVGWNWREGIIVQCYSTGAVSGTGEYCRAGGLVGYSDRGTEGISSSFWDIQTSGQTTSAGGTGKTTAQMQTAKTFLEAGWDFIGETANGTVDIWWIDEGQDYPGLWWELDNR